MLQPSALQDSLAALARDSARALLLEGGTDLRYFPEAWFFLGLAASILAWCWRSWREVHGLTPLSPVPKLRSAATEPDDSERARLGDSPDADAPVPLRCPACECVVGDTRAPLGYLSVCTACGRRIAVHFAEGRAWVVLRD